MSATYGSGSWQKHPMSRSRPSSAASSESTVQKVAHLLAAAPDFSD
ncbi:hypothetical protein ACWDTI_09040 [Gordonia sp. NPDC003424]